MILDHDHIFLHWERHLDRQRDQERQADEMNQEGADIYENVKGFMLWRGGSISHMSDQKTGCLRSPAGCKQHCEKQAEHTLLKTAVALLH